MAKEYIEREVAINEIIKCEGSVSYDFNEGLTVATSILDDIPAADVRPVVLCRNCQSYNKPQLGFCETHLVRTHGDDFCSYGKKREER